VGDYFREVGQHPVTPRHANLTGNALAAEVAASSLPALQAGRLVAFEVRIEPAKE
jgi:hypothetical protein